MASSQGVDSVLQCVICLNVFEDPRALPCTHTFCLKCLRQSFQNKDPDDKGDCPLCNRVFTVPAEGIDGIPRNELICQLLKVKQTSKTGISTRISANSTICDNINAKEKCEFHPKKTTELYCNNCQTSICVLCVAVKHKTSKCDIATIEQAAEEFRKQLAYEIHNVSACSFQVQNLMHKIELNKARFISQVSVVENDISKIYEDLLSIIQSYRNQLMTELNSFKDKVLMQIEQSKGEIEEEILKRQSFGMSCKDLVDNGTVFDISSVANKLLAEAKTLSKMADVVNDFSEMEVIFTSSAPSSDSSKNWIGELFFDGGATVFDTGKNDFESTALLKVPKLHAVVPFSESVNEFTVLGHELFVLRSSSSVFVYNSINFTLTRQLDVYGSESLCALVACPRNKCLYIHDDSNDTIYRCDLQTGFVINKWEISAACKRLSLTRNHTLLITMLKENQAVEYAANGTLMREIKFDKRIVCPHHCIQLPNDQFVVCHWSTPIAATSNIRILDGNGNILRSCIKPRSSFVSRLYGPCHIAVDNHGYIIVADFENDRVEILSPKLAHIGYIEIPGYKLDSPRTLHLDELNRRLYIGEFESERILVLKADMSPKNVSSPS